MRFLHYLSSHTIHEHSWTWAHNTACCPCFLDLDEVKKIGWSHHKKNWNGSDEKDQRMINGHPSCWFYFVCLSPSFLSTCKECLLWNVAMWAGMVDCWLVQADGCSTTTVLMPRPWILKEDKDFSSSSVFSKFSTQAGRPSTSMLVDIECWKQKIV